MARLRSGQPIQYPSTAKPTRQALKDRTNTAPRKAPVYEDDGDAEPLVKDARPKRGQQRKAAPKEDDQYVMAGGLGLREPDENLGNHTDPPTTTDELTKSDGPPRFSGRGVKPDAPSRASSKAGNTLKSRPQQTKRTAAAGKKSKDLRDDQIVISSSENISTKPFVGRKSYQSRTERSDFSLSPSPPSPGKLHSVKRSSIVQPGSALRVSGTPAVESSILALKNFKRRPRQPSMLQMVQQRTASARPSMQNTTTAIQAAELNVDNSDFGDEDDFAPDAEGTPVLKQMKAQAAPIYRGGTQKAVPAVLAESKKRKSDDVETSSSSLNALRAKRQKPSEADVGELTTSKLPDSVRRSSSTLRHRPLREPTSDFQVINSSSSTPPTDPPSPQSPSYPQDPIVIVPSTEKEEKFPVEADLPNALEEDVDDEFADGMMADPVSSSPLRSSPPQSTQQTDIMADPLTQISPPKPKLRDKKPEKKARPLDTATLQALLPKRRKPLQPQQRRSEYDFDVDPSEDEDGPIDTSHLDSDEDELSGRARRKSKAATNTKARKSTAAKSRKSKAAPISRKSTAASRKSKGSKGTAKTYGRSAASDKENDNDFEDAENDDSIVPDTSISGYEAAKSTELEAMRQKFVELDDWEMEFESVAVEEGRSSSQLWR